MTPSTHTTTGETAQKMPDIPEAAASAETAPTELPDFEEPVRQRATPQPSAVSSPSKRVNARTGSEPAILQDTAQSAAAASAPTEATIQQQASKGIQISTNTLLGFFGTLIAALIALFGSVLVVMFNSTSARLNNIEIAIGGLDTKIDAAVADLNTKIDTAVARLDTKIDTAVARLDTKIDTAVARLDAKIDTAVDKLSARIDSLASDVADINETLAVIVTVLNIRDEVAKAKAHEIIGATPTR